MTVPMSSSFLAFRVTSHNASISLPLPKRLKVSRNFLAAPVASQIFKLYTCYDYNYGYDRKAYLQAARARAE